jgi:hypothetical protein
MSGSFHHRRHPILGIISSSSTQVTTFIIGAPGISPSLIVCYARNFSLRCVRHSDLSKRTAARHSLHQVNQQLEQKATNARNIESASAAERD